MANDLMLPLQKAEDDLRRMLPPWITPDRWIQLAREVWKSKALQECAQKNPDSLLLAMKQIADWGLELDGEECVIIPYFDSDLKLPVAQAQPMYKGLIRRAVDAGAVAHVSADIIKEGDKVKIVSGTQGRYLEIVPAFGVKGGKRPIIGAYALFTLPNGLTDFELFELDDIEKVKAAAERMAQRRKKDAGLSPAWKQFEGEMIKKSVIRRGLKRMRGARDKAVESDRFAKVITPTPIDDDAEEVPVNLASEAVKEEPKSAAPPPPAPEDRSLNQQEQQELITRVFAKPMRFEEFMKMIVFKHTRATDLADVRVSQLAEIDKALGEYGA